eukprot:6502690-Pyramimonas_sp.AAC.1
MGNLRQLVDRELCKWKGIWAKHGLAQFHGPSDFHMWGQLSDMSVEALHSACLQFKETTAVGQVNISPRALWQVSDVGFIVLSGLLLAEGGGPRLIARVNSLVSLWARARSTISKQWVVSAEMSEVWGAGGAGRSPTAAACERNRYAETAALLGWHA